MPRPRTAVASALLTALLTIVFRRLRVEVWRAAPLVAGVLILVGAASAQQETELTGQALVDALRDGGYNIYFRHAQTSWSQSDRVDEAGDWKTCDPARMRQLSEDGRRTARRVGAAIRTLGLPVGRVLASEYCRAVETARLMSLGPVDTTTELMNTRVAEFHGGRDAVAERARRLLAMRPSAGSNTILVAHGNLLRAAAGVSLGEAGAGVFAPGTEGAFSLVARLSPADWVALAAAHRPPD